MTRRVAVVGGGISGLSAAYALRGEAEITIYEQNDYLGGHANTVEVDEPSTGRTLGLDTAFIVFNAPSYPGLSGFFDELGVKSLAHEGGFFLFDTDTGLQFGTPEFHQSLDDLAEKYPEDFVDICRQARRFHAEAPRDFLRKRAEMPLGEYLQRNGYTEAFASGVVVQLATAVWSMPPRLLWLMPASTFIAFFMAHDAEGLGGRQVSWRTVTGGSISYVRKAVSAIGATLRLADPVVDVAEHATGVTVLTRSGTRAEFDAVVLATHADEALAVLQNPTPAQQAVDVVRYNTVDCVLHTDPRVIEGAHERWGSWNFGSGTFDGERRAWPVYYLNKLQGFEADQDYFVTVDYPGEISPEAVIARFVYSHPVITCDVRALQSTIYRAHDDTRVILAGSYLHSKKLGPDQIGSHEAAFASGREAARVVSRLLASSPRLTLA